MSLGRLWFERPVPADVAEALEGTVEILGPDEGELPTANGAIVGSGVWDHARFEITSELKVASRTGIGIDKMDLDAATRHGVMITNTPDGPTVSTAEHALALMLAVAKRLPAAQRRLREGERTTVTGHGATELDGLTLGLVGYGRIGRRVAGVARALGMRIAVYDPYAVVDDADQVGSVTELFAGADVVSLHLPLTPETNALIGAEVLTQARPGTLLVNTARGGLVDQDALIDALDEGRLAGAGLDVTDPEPLPPDHPLLQRDDVIVTPHVASSTVVGTRRMLDMAIEQALMALRGERPTHLVNPEVAHMTRRLGIGVIGFGWMGQAHSRSYARIPTLFPERAFDPDLVICSDNVAERGEEAVRSFGFRESATDWRRVIEHPDVDVVTVCAPNMLHVEMCEAAAAAGTHVFCEKPVGGTPEQTARIEKAARDAGVITGVGYNYRWAPLVRYAKQLIADGALGEITNYRGRFFTMYGSDPLGLLSWRFEQDQAGYGVSTDILSHSIDLAHMLVGPIDRVVGTAETFIPQRPLPQPGVGTHYERGSPDDPTGPVTNEDYAGALAAFANGTRGTFEASRTIVGPQSQMAFDVYGTKGALSWNLETMNEMQVFLVDDHYHDGYTTVYSGDRYGHHGNFVPGDANAIGYEDLKVIEGYEYLSSVAKAEPHEPGFDHAVDYVSVQAALVRSWESERWEDVQSVRID